MCATDRPLRRRRISLRRRVRPVPDTRLALAARHGSGGALLVACATALLASCAPADTGREAVRGAILIVVDTLRADHVGVYGDTRDLTPSLDRFATRSLVFANATATSGWTRPSIASMFTGRYPTTVSMLDDPDVLGAGIDTLAELLGEDGIRSYGISTNPNAGREFGFAQGFDVFVDDLPRKGYEGDFRVVGAHEVTKRALEILDGIEPDERFFLFLHYIDPHAPYLPHPELFDRAEPAGRFDGSVRQLRQIGADATETDRDRIRHLYAGEVHYADHWIGVLFDGLVERDLFDELAVVVTSDHGEGLWDHGVRTHGQDLYAEMIQVPLLVKLPGTEPRINSALASHIDVAPTLLGAFGLAVPTDHQGRDLGAAARTGRLESWHRIAYAEITRDGIDLEAVHDGETKIIRDRRFDQNKAGPFEHVVHRRDSLHRLARRFYDDRSYARRILELNPELGSPRTAPSGIELEEGMVLRMPARRVPPGQTPLEVYNLATDPRERSDLVAAEPHTAELSSLLERLADENRRQQVDGERISVDELDAAAREHLEVLGYLGN